MPHRSSFLLGATAIVTIAALIGLGAPSATQAENSSARRTPVVRAVELARPSVVNIHGRKHLTDAGLASPDGQPVNGMGTGIIIDPRGYIMTNYHVVQGVAEILVTRHTGDEFQGRLVAHDPKTDLAIVKISSESPLPTITAGTSRDLMPGETVIAVGNAYGYNHTVTKGIISALHRTVQVSDEQKYRDLIQTDASINPGNSGGPLLNIDGEMIGINVAVRVGAQGIGFAIPVDEAYDVAARLLSVERIGNLYHGATGKRVGEAGFVVDQIGRGSPAESSGLKSGDEVFRVGGQQVNRPLDFERLLLGRKAGEEIELSVRRNGEELTLSLVLRESRTGQERLIDRVWQTLGLKLKPVSNAVFRQLNTHYRGGLQVTSVRPNSPGSRQGIRSGDVLVGVHKWETVSLDNVAYILRSDEFVRAQPAKFYILRNGETLFGRMKVEANSFR